MVPSSAATASRADVTKVLKASNTPTLVRHFPFSRIVSSVLNTMRVDSGGKSFKTALTAAVAALRTTSPLSIYSSNKIGKESRRMGATGGPKILAKDWKAMAADSRS